MTRGTEAQKGGPRARPTEPQGASWPQSLEESPEEFMARFGDYIGEVYLFPQPWGSPLLEVKVGERILYAFDRGAPPAPTGWTKGLLHGVAEEGKPWEGKAFLRREGPRYLLAGETQNLGEGFLLVEAGVRVLVYWPGPPFPKGWFRLAPPLMLFRL